MNLVTKEAVMEVICSVLKKTQLTISEDNNLTEYGMDSISFIRMVIMLEDYFGCEIPMSSLLIAEMNTVNKIFKVLVDLKANKEMQNDNYVNFNN